MSPAGPGRRAAVVGAGIGGLAAALSLHEIGLQVEVFDSARELRPLGVGINLLPHAVRELGALGLFDELLAHAIAPSTLVYCTKRGQEIGGSRVIAAGYPGPQLSIHRGLLQEVLRVAVTERLGQDAIHLGRRLVRVGGNDRKAVAEFDEGELEADLVVAADGIHSAARAQRYPDEGGFLWNGSLLWRGIAEVNPVLDGRSMIWAGHPEQKFVGYPIADLPGGRQRFNFIAELRRPDSDLGRAEDWNRRGALDDFLPQFKEWDFGWLDVPGIVAAAPETFLFPMVDRNPIPAGPSGGPPFSAMRRIRLFDRIQRRLPGHFGCARAGQLPAAAPGRRGRGLATLRGGPAPRHGGDRAGKPWAWTRASDAAGQAPHARRLRRHRRCDRARGDSRRHGALSHHGQLLTDRVQRGLSLVEDPSPL